MAFKETKYTQLSDRERAGLIAQVVDLLHEGDELYEFVQEAHQTLMAHGVILRLPVADHPMLVSSNGLVH